MLPEAFLERMERMLGEEYGAFLESYGMGHVQGLKLNPGKIGWDGRSAVERFGAGAIGGQSAGGMARDAGFAHLSPVPWAEDGYYYLPSDQPGKHPFHEAGVYYIQEPSAMAPVELLEVRPGERILDLCAAPGGKSVQIAGKLRGQGILVCNEIHPARAKILSENIERMGIGNACVLNETPERLAEAFPGYFDRVLVDAPCSGEGMFRRSETAREEWSPENVGLCARRQDGILDCAARMLRAGGRLVYSTCTFAPEEDEGSVGRFLQRHGEFWMLPVDKERLGLLGCDGMTDGMEAVDCGTDQEENSGPRGGDGLSEGPDAVGYGPDLKEDLGLRGGDGLWDGSDAAVCMPGLENALRLWPHRIQGEGHFAAALQKDGVLIENYRKSDSENRAKGASKGAGKKMDQNLSDEFLTFCAENLLLPGDGSDICSGLGQAVGLEGGLRFMSFGENLYLVPADMPPLKGLKALRPGLHLGELRKNRFEPSHALALALCPACAAHVWNLEADSPAVSGYLRGQTFPAEGGKGWYLICVEGFGTGWGKLAAGIMKNHYPRGLRK